jgi:hypothetical protein
MAILKDDDTPLTEDQDGLEQSIADRVFIHSPTAEVPAYVLDKLHPMSEKTESSRASLVPDDSGPSLAVSNGLNFFEMFAELVNNSPRVQELSQVGIGAWCTAERVEEALGILSREERMNYGVAEYLRDYYPAPDEMDRDGLGINDDASHDLDSNSIGMVSMTVLYKIRIAIAEFSTAMRKHNRFGRSISIAIVRKGNLRNAKPNARPNSSHRLYAQPY